MIRESEDLPELKGLKTPSSFASGLIRFPGQETEAEQGLVDQARRKSSWIRASLSLTFRLIAGRAATAAAPNRGTKKSEASGGGLYLPRHPRLWIDFTPVKFILPKTSHLNKGPAPAGPLFLAARVLAAAAA